MPFNSISFVLFFLVFAALYFFIKSHKLKSFLLLAGSYGFYAYSNIFNLIFLISTTIITAIIANRLIKTRKNNYYLFVGVAFILVQLVFTKYSRIIFDEFSAVSLTEYSYLNIFILPIGISFYSLQAISLLVDVKRGTYKGDTSWKSISQFLSFFPQSISGPIHRANELIPQFAVSKYFVTENIIIGFKTVLWGYFCKLMVADKIAQIVTPIFSSYQDQDGLSITIAALLYSFQIYFDFWGYSLIAIGVGRILGFTININFVNPYLAKSFKEFWHRWHITLSKWMRDYIYIPMGGSKQKHYLIFCLSILATFLLSGFWHGATLNFILWGAAHAFLYLAEDLFSKLFSFDRSRFYKLVIQPIWTIIFFILISFTWLIFRTNSIPELTAMLNSIISLNEWTTQNTLNHYISTTNIIYLAFIVSAILLAQSKLISRIIDTVPVTVRKTIADTAFVSFCLVVIILWGDIGGQEFLYFRF